jgi:hypothetical protein
MSEDYIMTSNTRDGYERVTNIAGVKTTICKNRFEVLCLGLAEVNEQQVIHELKAWIAKRREAEMRESGDMPKEVS